MIDVATLSVIRRWALREQLSIREIARRTGLSRNTIRKYLREGEAAPSYTKRISPSKLDAFAEKLGGWLKSEASKSRKQRRTLKQMHADLCALGFNGSYDRVAAFARQWKVDQLDRVKAASKGTLEDIQRSLKPRCSLSPALPHYEQFFCETRGLICYTNVEGQ